MPAPLAIPANRHRPTGQIQPHRQMFGAGIGGHDRFGGQTAVRRRQSFGRHGNAFCQPIHRQRHANHPGGEHQNLVSSAAQRLGGCLLGGAGVGQPWFASAGVGVFGIDHHGAQVAVVLRQRFPVHNHRGGHHLVFGKHGGTAAIGFGYHQGQVELVLFFDSGGDGNGRKSRR
jgi:hypothetical protein